MEQTEKEMVEEIKGLIRQRIDKSKSIISAPKKKFFGDTAKQNRYEHELNLMHSQLVGLLGSIITDIKELEKDERKSNTNA